MSSLSQRNRRYERQEQPGQMRETPADKEIVRLVYEYKVLTQPQIHRLTKSKHMTTTQRRLRRLYDHKYLERLFLPVVHFGSSPTLYILDRRGEALLRREGVEDFTGQPGKDLSTFFLEHAIAISEVRINLSEACEAAGLSILTWLGESQLKADYDRVKLPDKRRSVSVIPDSYFVVEIPGRGVSHFFLELDRGTMTTKRFKQKVEAYAVYYRGGTFSERFGARGFRVLTVVDSLTRARVENLATMATSVEKIGRRFWFAHMPETTPDKVLTAPIWTIAGEKQAVALFEL